MQKKRNGTPTPSEPRLALLDIKDDPTLTAGDVETYAFDYPAKQSGDHIYEVWKKDTPEPPRAEIIGTELANEKSIAELMAKFAKLTPVVRTEPARRSLPRSSPGKPLADVKELSESLKRIIRYNNKRKYEERVGFATTIASNAEEIGRKNTVAHLLPAIASHLV
ncbi:MAG: hypothetical protein P4L67_02605 [Candidatus Pacebacteria bacterium]|nr:hypothetical protein [Candidatus Paceibacterota bacterium]